MSAYITPECLSNFYHQLKKNNKSPNTISAYSRNINKLVQFLNGSEWKHTKTGLVKKGLNSVL